MGFSVINTLHTLTMNCSSALYNLTKGQKMIESHELAENLRPNSQKKRSIMRIIQNIATRFHQMQNNLMQESKSVEETYLQIKAHHHLLVSPQELYASENMTGPATNQNHQKNSITTSVAQSVNILKSPKFIRLMRNAKLRIGFLQAGIMELKKQISLFREEIVKLQHNTLSQRQCLHQISNIRPQLTDSLFTRNYLCKQMRNFEQDIRESEETIGSRFVESNYKEALQLEQTMSSRYQESVGSFNKMAFLLQDLTAKTQALRPSVPTAPNSPKKVSTDLRSVR